MLWLSIPDTNFNKQVIISIDQSKEGFLKSYIQRLANLRKDLKLKEKKSTGQIKEQYHAQQNAVKVIQNIIYGYQGLEFSNYGDMATAIAIVGCCRWVTTYVKSLLNESIIEIDTDGVYLSKSIDVEDLNNKIANKIHEEFGIKECIMKVELEEFNRSFFYRMKNYLLENGDKLIFHGVSFKSSRHPGLYDKALQEVAKDILDNKGIISDHILKNIRDLSKYNLNDFILRGKIQKDPKEYDNPNALQGMLMDQVEYTLKRKAEINDQIEYYVTIDPAPVPKVLKKLQVKKTKGSNYTISQLVSNRNQLNMEYYSNEIEKVIDLFTKQEEEKEVDIDNDI
jgi:DNA polymerase elongation subunit (family B)